MDKDITKGSLDDILSSIDATDKSMPFSVKGAKGQYLYANEAWGNLAEATPQRILGKCDEQLPWGKVHGSLVHLMDAQTKTRGKFSAVDRRPHFKGKYWLRTATDKFYLREQKTIITRVQASKDEEFCQLATQVTEKGILHNGVALSIKQLYLLHQLLFHVPQKQSARELNCSTNRINQYLRGLQDKFEADDTKELMCFLSAQGFFPLLERFDLLFNHGWIQSELRFS